MPQPKKVPPGLTRDHGPAETWTTPPVVDPLPSWPLPLSPQHQELPSVREPQACVLAIVTVDQVVRLPSWVGVCTSAPPESKPSCLESLRPQHHRVWSVRTAQVPVCPALT